MLHSALHPPSPSLGSLANLDIERIPEGADGFRVVNEWTQYVCCAPIYNVQEPTDLFRQYFMVASTLAFDLDRENAWDFVPPTLMCRETLWPRALLRKPGREFYEQEFVGFITAEGYDLLTFGSFYLRYVMHKWM